MKETDSSLDGFLSGLKLHRVGQSLPKREIKKNERPRATNYDKFMEIDLSSPLGKYIVSSSGLSISQMNPASRGYKSLGRRRTTGPFFLFCLFQRSTTMSLTPSVPALSNPSRTQTLSWTLGASGLAPTSCRGNHFEKG